MLLSESLHLGKVQKKEYMLFSRNEKCNENNILPSLFVNQPVFRYIHPNVDWLQNGITAGVARSRQSITT